MLLRLQGRARLALQLWLGSSFPCLSHSRAAGRLPAFDIHHKPLSIGTPAHLRFALLAVCCRFSGVHRLNAGLWGRQANITLSSNGGRGEEWGKVDFFLSFPFFSPCFPPSQTMPSSVACLRWQATYSVA